VRAGRGVSARREMMGRRSAGGGEAAVRAVEFEGPAHAGQAGEDRSPIRSRSTGCFGSAPWVRTGGRLLVISVGSRFWQRQLRSRKVISSVHSLHLAAPRSSSSSSGQRFDRVPEKPSVARGAPEIAIP
jgi:hypothetical protein